MSDMSPPPPQNPLFGITQELLLPFQRAGQRAGRGISIKIQDGIQEGAGREFDENEASGVYREQKSLLQKALIGAAAPSFPNPFDTLARFPVVWERALIDMRRFYRLGVGLGYDDKSFVGEERLGDEDRKCHARWLQNDQKRIAEAYNYPLDLIKGEVQPGGPENLAIYQRWLYMEGQLEKALMQPITLGTYSPIDTHACGLLFPKLDFNATGHLLAVHRATNRELFLTGYERGKELSEPVSPKNMLYAFASCILLGQSSTGK